MKVKGLIYFALFCAAIGPLYINGQAKTKPNVLLIVSEDHGPHLSCYGDTNVQTPNLDQLAGQGILFRNAYVTESVCSPSRSSILTGLYPHQSGHLGLTTHGFHYVGQVPTIYALLKKAGYRTGMIGKLHLKPEALFPIDEHPIKSPNYEKKGLERYAAYAGKFMRASDEPFFLMVNFPDTHWPFQDQVEGRPSKTVTPAQVTSFPYIGFDNERIRSYTSSIYNCMLRLDGCIGELMQQLEQSGKLRNTLVIFLSDHGDEMARGKFDIYEASNKVPFIASWPGVIGKGMQSQALVSSVDIVPTVLELAGIAKPRNLTGKSLMPLFAKPGLQFREYLFTEKNADQIGMYYPRRAVRDGRYKIIYSLLDDGRKNEVAVSYTRNSLKPRTDAVAGSPTLEELKSAPAFIQKAYNDWILPAKVQLYDLEKDPYEFYDLSADPHYAAVKGRLLKALFRWQKETGDPLRFPDKLKRLTQENDTMKVSKNMQWHYPEYLYGHKR
ncbi:sulfatase family protein [Niabella aurantiaca]|uniref:sulfatase family protein n=1 Tax=Niabella aurantiaca TaxID=379900 RepID=UPI000379820C|nr:sulfatase [Niabella aurantiaca]